MCRTGASVYCSSSPSPLPRLPRAWHAKRLHSHSVAQAVQQCQAGYVSAAAIPVAIHAQPAARLLVELRALERQRCGSALLGCCLRRARLSMRLAHLGILSRSAGPGACWEDKKYSHRLSCAIMCPKLSHLNCVRAVSTIVQRMHILQDQARAVRHCCAAAQMQ